MRAAGKAIVAVCATISLGGLPAASQTSKLNHLPPARAPCSVLSGHPCHPSFCGVFHRGPCFSYELSPLGEALRLTVVSTDANDRTDNSAGADAKTADHEGSKDDHALETIRDMFAALRACWIPPPKDEARQGMEYTIRFAFKGDGEMIAPPRTTYASHDAPAAVRNVYRDAVNAALARCTPLHFSEGMGDAIAGRPIAIRFVDERTIGDQSGK